MNEDSKNMPTRATAPRARPRRSKRVEVTFSDGLWRRIDAQCRRDGIAAPDFVRAATLDALKTGGALAIANATCRVREQELRRIADYALWLLHRLDHEAVLLPTSAPLSDHVAAVAVSFRMAQLREGLRELIAELAAYNRSEEVRADGANDDPSDTGFDQCEL